MKRTLFPIISLFFLVFILNSSNPQQQQSAQIVNWETIDKLIEQDLPESALKELEKYKDLLNKSDYLQERIKAELYAQRIRMDKNPDEIADILKDIEVFTYALNKSAEQQLMFCTLAELYLTHYYHNSYNIDRRTQVLGNIPDDINIWTKNHYEQKVNILLNEALKDKEFAQNTALETLKSLLFFYDSDMISTPSLYDYLLRKKIEIYTPFNDQAIVNQTYKELIEFRKAQKDTVLLVIAELDYLDFQENNSTSILEKLDSLEKIYRKNEAVIEIYSKKANYYLNNNDIPKHKELAHEVCVKGLTEHPNYKRINLLYNLKKDIENKYLVFNGKTQVKPFSQLELTIDSKNIDELSLEIYRLNISPTDFFLYELNKRINPKDEISDKKLIEQKNIQVKTEAKFETTTTKFNITTSDYGIYECRIRDIQDDDKEENNANQTAVFHFVTTDMTYIKKDISDMETTYYVVDRITGKRMKNVELDLYEYKFNINKYELTHLKTAKTDSKGKITISRNKPYSEVVVHLKNKKDINFLASTYASFYSTNRNAERVQENISMFTDRSIYRPGQTIYFKAIAYSLSKEKQEVNPNKKITIDLIDANGKTIQSKELISNEFGSVAGEFILPSTGLNGYFTLRANRQYFHRFRVEEYKRPSFEVLIEQPKDEVRFGYKVTLEGEVKAYSGHSLPNAEIRYTINRHIHPFWRWFIPQNITDMEESGTLTTDAKGKFTICFTPAKDKNLTDNQIKQLYYYTINVDATDSKGETQQGKINIAVGEQSLFIHADIPQKIDKAKEQSFTVSTQTLNGETIDKLLNYQIYSIFETSDYAENIIANDDYKELVPMAESTFDTQDKALKIDFSNYQSGRYKIKFATKDMDGKNVESEHYFIVYSAKDKKPPIKTYTWVVNKQIETEVGEKVDVSFGTSVKNAEVLMEVMFGNQLISSKWVKFNNAIRHYKVHFAPQYRDGITVMFTFIRDERLFTESIRISEKKVSKAIHPTMSTFRDKLKPGEEVEWTVEIPETGANRKIVELLASMYDASLDALESHQWLFNPTHHTAFPYSNAWSAYFKAQDYKYIHYSADYKDVPSYHIPSSNKFGLLEINLRYNYNNIRIRGGKKSLKYYGNDDVLILQSSTLMSQESAPFMEEKSEMEVADDVFEIEDAFEIENLLKPSVRTNFNETAFFFPQLYNDSLGNVKLQFTMPESLTKWKFNALAHTKDLYFGQYETEITTEQNLMIQMNMPRFVRESDVVDFTANLTNLSDKNLDAAVQLVFINPNTEEIVPLNNTDKIPVAIEAGSTIPISWRVKGFKPSDLYICKITASTAEFSDGEQHYLAVLPDRVLVTESYPISTKGYAKHQFSFDKITELIDKVDTQKLSLEFTANPIWYAIQALPALSTPQYDNAIDYFTAYYVNTLAGKIIADNPKIKAVFEQWKVSKSTNLRSALLNNPELKQMLIEETPWLAAAENETEQQERIALLFDINQQCQQQQIWIEKLQSLQLNNGSFTWYNGMLESRWITQQIAEGLIKIKSLNQDNRTEEMLQNAIHYLDNQINKDYLLIQKNIKDYQKKQTINSNQLHYLALRSQVLDIELNEQILEAYVYFLEQAEKYHPKFGLLEKGLAAIALHHNEKIDARDKALQSLYENALKTDEMGMYWTKNTAGYSWNQRPISVQVKLMEALYLSDKYANDIKEMKVWLLRQKQTQIWDTPISSVDAIHALTSLENNPLQHPVHYTISTSKQSFSTIEGVSGSGYIFKDLQTDDIKAGVRIQAENASNTVNSPRAWGSVYWQYFQNMDEVRTSGKELQITKQLFVEKITADKKIMLPLNDAKDKDYAQIVKKGDKIIVRLIISSDRDMEFVALKDSRPSNLEPLNQLSSTNWRENLVYYRSVKDASTNYFIHNLPKGTYVFEDEYFVNNSGEFSGGMAELQSMYAPEYKTTGSCGSFAVE